MCVGLVGRSTDARRAFRLAPPSMCWKGSSQHPQPKDASLGESSSTTVVSSGVGRTVDRARYIPSRSTL